MTAKKIYYATLGATTIMVLLIVVSAIMANNFLEQQKEKLAQIKVENSAVEQQQLYLVQAKNDLQKYSELAQIVKTIVPQDKDQAKTVREINAIAQSSGISLNSITFKSSNLGTKKTPQKSGDNTQSAPKSNLSQVSPVKGIDGVYAMEITIASRDPVSYHQFLDFLEKLESKRRTAHVQQIGLNPSPEGDSLSFTLTLNAFVKP